MNQYQGEDDLRAEILRFSKYLNTLQELLEMTIERGRFISWTGEPLSAESREQAIQQEIVRSHELVRLRQKVQASDLSDRQKADAYTLINLVARFLHRIMEIGNDADAMELIDRVEYTMSAFFPVRT